MTIRYLLAAVAAFSASPALSQDWDGPYGGLQLGYLWADTSGAATTDGDDVIAGAHLGYNFDIGSFVLGGEPDFDTADVDLDGAATIDGVARLKFRGGADLGVALAYGTFGFAEADTSLGDDDGWFIGAGYGLDIGGGWVFGGELLYHEFDDINGSGVDAEATTLSLRATFNF